MKKVVFVIILVLIILLLLLICTYNKQEISSNDRITGKEISSLNSKFEQYYGINKSDDLKRLLQYCIENYEYRSDECAKVPTIKYITEKYEIVLEYEPENIFEIEYETEYYVGLNNLLKNISSDKLYKVEFKYMDLIIDNVSLINEIDIIEVEQ